VRFEPPRPRDDDERVLPLINVVFLLLIFFMLAGALAPADPFRVDPPLSRSEAPPPAEPLTLLIGADGELALDGEPLDEAGLLDRLGELIERRDGRTRAAHQGRCRTRGAAGGRSAGEAAFDRAASRPLAHHL
jgi:biopolymer transport protein ExbD